MQGAVLCPGAGSPSARSPGAGSHAMPCCRVSWCRVSWCGEPRCGEPQCGELCRAPVQGVLVRGAPVRGAVPCPEGVGQSWVCSGEHGCRGPAVLGHPLVGPVGRRPGAAGPGPGGFCWARSLSCACWQRCECRSGEGRTAPVGMGTCIVGHGGDGCWPLLCCLQGWRARFLLCRQGGLDRFSFPSQARGPAQPPCSVSSHHHPLPSLFQTCPLYQCCDHLPESSALCQGTQEQGPKSVGKS